MAMMKRLAKLTIAIIWRGGQLLGEFLIKTGSRQKKKLTILTYHGVTKSERLAFESQMRQLPRHGKPVPADINTEEMEPGNNIAVTFDDGYVNIIDNALPSLKTEGIPATIFITAAYMGKNADWAGEETKNRQELIMNEEQIRSAWNKVINIGSHGMTHRDLSKLDDDSANFELTESRRILENCLNRSIDLFSFPFGVYDDRVVQLAEQAGYRFVFRNTPDPKNVSNKDIRRGRVSVDPNDWPQEYRLKMSGAYDWLPRAVTFKKNITFLFRNIIGYQRKT